MYTSGQAPEFHLQFPRFGPREILQLFQVWPDLGRINGRGK
jgi:hypothetical protein